MTWSWPCGSARWSTSVSWMNPSVVKRRRTGSSPASSSLSSTATTNQQSLMTAQTSSLTPPRTCSNRDCPILKLLLVLL